MSAPTAHACALCQASSLSTNGATNLQLSPSIYMHAQLKAHSTALPIAMNSRHSNCLYSLRPCWYWIVWNRTLVDWAGYRHLSLHFKLTILHVDKKRKKSEERILLSCTGREQHGQHLNNWKSETSKTQSTSENSWQRLDGTKFWPEPKT